jgi:hypothetical protein
MNIATLLTLILNIGFSSVTVENATASNELVKYYNQDTKTIYDCTMAHTDIGTVSVCQSSASTAIIFVLVKKQSF